MVKESPLFAESAGMTMRRAVLLMLVLLCGCTNPARERTMDPDAVAISFANSSGRNLVIVAGPPGTSFEDAAADEYVHSLPANTGGVIKFVYPNTSSDGGEWCFEQVYWVARSRSGTVYFRDGEFETAIDEAAAREAEAGQPFGTKWRWTDRPGVDSSDLEIVEAIVADECIDSDTFSYWIAEVYGGEGRIEVEGSPAW